MTCFLVIDLILPFFSQIFRIFTMLNVVYDLFFTRKTTISEKNSFMTAFFYSVHTFARIPQHYFSKHWGTDAWAVPPPQIFGDRPPIPPRSPPLHIHIYIYMYIGPI